MHKYTKVKEVGKGSYGVALLVKDKEGKDYVMKKIDTSRMSAKERKEAQNEVTVLSSVKHPYIVNYRENFMDRNHLCIVMDYAEGGDLYKYVEKVKRRGEKIPEATVLKWFTQATLALKYLHDRHILHRDLKTQNLFLSANGRLRMGDFGISKTLENTNCFAMTQIGTPYYLSPEICQRKPYSWATDVWSLGCVLFELCALRVPFDGGDLRQLVNRICSWPAPHLPNGYSKELDKLCTELLNRDYRRRITSAEILQRPLVQQEIKRMLEEEHKEGHKDGEDKAKNRGGAPAVNPDKKENVPMNVPNVDLNAAPQKAPFSARNHENYGGGNHGGVPPYRAASPSAHYRAPSPAMRAASPAHRAPEYPPSRGASPTPFHRVPSPRHRQPSPPPGAWPSPRSRDPSPAHRAPSPIYQHHNQRPGMPPAAGGARPHSQQAGLAGHAQRWMHGR